MTDAVWEVIYVVAICGDLLHPKMYSKFSDSSPGCGGSEQATRAG